MSRMPLRLRSISQANGFEAERGYLYLLLLLVLGVGHGSLRHPIGNKLMRRATIDPHHTLMSGTVIYSPMVVTTNAVVVPADVWPAIIVPGIAVAGVRVSRGR